MEATDPPEFPRSEVEDAFRNYLTCGIVNEDWDAWAKCFTPDVEYHEHQLGFMQGRDAVLAWIAPLMVPRDLQLGRLVHGRPGPGRLRRQQPARQPPARGPADRLRGGHDPAVRRRRHVLA
jgi:hypothetical protein